MKTTTTNQVRRQLTPHTDWYAGEQSHLCGVAQTLRWMRALLAAVAIRPGVLRGQNERPAVSGRKAIGR